MTVDEWIQLFSEDEKYYNYAVTIDKYIQKRQKRWGKDKDDILARSFEWTDVSIPWYELNKMMIRGLLKITLSSNAHKFYTPTSLEDLKKAIKDYEKLKQIQENKVEDGKIEGIPEDIFHPIVGFDDIKDAFLMSLRSEKPVHICLIGPPATAKSLFLIEIARIKGSYYAVGSRTSGAGLSRILFERKPKLLLIDEIDKMASNPNDLSVLLSLMETGRIVETKATRMGEVQLNTRVFAAGNTDIYLPPELKSRFIILHLREYTDKEFLEVTERFLTEREEVKSEIARYIAKKVLNISRDVRQARNIARLCKTKACVDKIINLLEKYRI